MHAKHALWITLALSASAGAQSIYQCFGPNGVVFSQTPCGPDAVRSHINAPAANAENAARMERENQARWEAETLQRERNDHQRELDRLHRMFQAVQAERSKELRDIDAERATAMNNLAGATYLQALALREKAIIDRYEARLNEIRGYINEKERSWP